METENGMVFLVDFENIKTLSKESVEKLKRKDEIILFVSENTPTIRVDLIESLLSSRASVHIQRGTASGKNALDHLIAGYLGMRISTSRKKDFFIISKDTGFDSAVKFFHQKTGRAHRITSLEHAWHSPGEASEQPASAKLMEAVPDSLQARVSKILPDECESDPRAAQTICEFMEKSKSLVDFHNVVRQKFGPNGQKYQKIYKTCKSLYKDRLKKQS